MVLQQLLLLLGAATSFPFTPPRIGTLSGEAFSNNFSVPDMDEQVAIVQAQLPPGFIFNISLTSTSFPQINHSTPVISPFDTNPIACIDSRPIPPNLDDCGTLIATMSQFRPGKIFPPSPGYCNLVQYRSCSSYNCAGKCAKKGFEINEWCALMDPIFKRCIIDRGMSGLAVGKREDGRGWGKMAGIEHSEALKQKNIPPADPCKETVFTPP